MKTERLLYADILRILATFAVIILHVAAGLLYSLPINSFEWEVANIFDSCVRWAVPVFFMLSGMFFLDPDIEIDNRKIYTKNIIKLVLALCFWGVLYQMYHCILLCFREGMTVSAFLSELKNSLLKIIFGPAWYHLWFIYSIIGYYMLIPFFRMITKYATRKDLLFLISIIFVIGSLIPFVNENLRLSILPYKINFSIAEATGYSGYFFLGYYLKKYDVKKVFRRIFKISLPLMFILAAVMTSRTTKNMGWFYDNFYGNMCPMSFIESIGVFLLVKDLFNWNNEKYKSSGLVLHISKKTFGIYLVHDFCNILFNKIGHFDLMKCYFYIPLRSILSFLISLFIIEIMHYSFYLFKRIFQNSKILKSFYSNCSKNEQLL